MFHKLLVNIDDDTEHLPMVEKAARLAACEGDLELFCVAFQPLIRSAGVFSEEAERRSRHAYMTQCEGRLDYLADRIRLDPSRVGTDVCWDENRAEAVLRKCERYSADLLVYPVSTQPVLLHHLLAPEDWRVLRKCPVPLLLSRDRNWPEHPRIAVALDPFHPLDEPAALDGKLFGIAHRLVRELEGELHVLHAFNALPQSAVFDEHRITDFAGLQANVAKEHRERLEALLAPWQKEAGAALLHLLEGELHQRVPRICEEQRIDLLIMGNVRRGLLERLLVGSSAERVLDRIHCDLMVVKPD
ncbi:universal stress protein [Marinobacterium sp. D7]|uniref:universal stress protein n=1 Tax=Marinobacterium ramblicola TaxID=2849041 RepID=UPI001C2D9D58|nr:universal stress protein [Marinobacterium ramblicola]MBV1786479.1 universal stress protein [Marinobacterium ramblicola]